MLLLPATIPDRPQPKPMQAKSTFVGMRRRIPTGPPIALPAKTQSIATIRQWPGKQLAAFIDGRRVLLMHKSMHKQFYVRVRELEAEARAKRAQLEALQIILKKH